MTRTWTASWRHSTLPPAESLPGAGTDRETSGLARATPVISLLTDYGWADGFVGAVHSVLRQRLPLVPIVDLTHGIAAHDVRAGSLALRRAAPYLASGVVLAVVDPGVGTGRRGVAVQVGHVRGQGPAAGIVFVGPDNGLLVPAIEARGGAGVAVHLEDRGYWLRSPGPTFAGRDVFAPAAAHLAAGGDMLALGRPIDPGTLARLPVPICTKHNDGSLEAEVIWVDHFGNIQLAAGPADLPGNGDLEKVTVTTAPTAVGGRGPSNNQGAPRWTARLVQVFGDLGTGELGLLVDSCGHLALCLFGASAAEWIGASERDVLVLSAPGTAQGQ